MVKLHEAVNQLIKLVVITSNRIKGWPERYFVVSVICLQNKRSVLYIYFYKKCSWLIIFVLLYMFIILEQYDNCVSILEAANINRDDILKKLAEAEQVKGLDFKLSGTFLVSLFWNLSVWYKHWKKILSKFLWNYKTNLCKGVLNLFKLKA